MSVEQNGNARFWIPLLRAMIRDFKAVGRDSSDRVVYRLTSELKAWYGSGGIGK
jgi:hypothetical protein